MTGLWRFGMNNKILLFTVTLFFVFVTNGYSACTDDGSNEWTTDGNESVDVAECISGATAGDTINVIAGDGAATWAGGSVTMPIDKPLNIAGPGSDLLTITVTDSSNGAIVIFPYVATAELKATTISGLGFYSASDVDGIAIEVSGQGWRIHNNKYEAVSTTSGTSNFIKCSNHNSATAPYGLIDNNEVINGKILNFGFSSATFAQISSAWYNALDLGGDDAVYVEDNSFTNNTPSYLRLFIDESYGGRYVARYNTFDDGYILVHGLQSDSMRGSRSWEIYGNEFTSALYRQGQITILSGTGVAYNNNFIGTDPAHLPVYQLWLGHERSTASASWGDAGECNGTSQWDENTTGEDGWLCRDQLGAGIDASLWVDETTLPAPDQTKKPGYFWGLYKIEPSSTMVTPYLHNHAEDHIQENRDYGSERSTGSFDGTGASDAGGGVGCGAIGSRPTTCTSGVAYWLTTQSCDNMTDYVGTSPTTPIDGTLYKCTSTDTWTEYYTPYTYPHPLRGVGLITVSETLTTSNINSGTLTTSNINSGGLTISNVQ